MAHAPAAALLVDEETTTTTCNNGGKYGERVLVKLIDHTSATDPSRECFSFPLSSDPKMGWRRVSWSQYANSINRMAYYILETCGPPPPSPPNSFPTIAYVGPSDARYVIFVIAAIKAGYKALFTSPGNSEACQLNLFEKTQCSTIYYDLSFEGKVKSLVQKQKMTTIVLDHLDRWLADEKVPHFPYERDAEEAKWDPFVVLHTSGSTGMPKPIFIKQGMLMLTDAFHDLPEWHGTHIFLHGYAKSRILLPMPLFHASGLYGFFGSGLLWDSPMVLPIGSRPFTGDLVLEMLTYADVGALFLPPSILEELSVRDDAIEAFKKLTFIGFGGGSLAVDVGNKLVENGVVLCNSIGSTECCTLTYYWQNKPELWQWFIINSDIMGIEWRSVAGEKDVFELVIVRKDKHPGMQGVFYALPELDEYSTSDLFIKHPTLPDHWKYHGRIDTIIVFSNGEKLNPITIEDTVVGHDKVKGAIVVGSGRFQPALLLEPVHPPNDEAETEEFIESVWPWIVKVNKETATHGRISRQLIAITKPEKPLPRLAKDVIQRAASIKLYESEINNLYERAEEGWNNRDVCLDSTSEESLTSSVAKLFQTLTDTCRMEADTDFFNAGIDSQQVINACRLLRGGLDAAGVIINRNIITPRVVYSNSSPRKLASYLYSHTKDIAENVQDENAEQYSEMEALLEKYSKGWLTTPGTVKPDPQDMDQVVILTGSTGGLGSHLLDQMSSCPFVKKIVCLNRSVDALKRQAQNSKARGLATDFTKIEFLHADLSQPDLGLGDVIFNQLLQEADRVVHAQWPVNFNLSLSSFEPQIQGVRHLADFSARAKKRVPIIFVSSTSAINIWTGPGPVPEEPLEDLTLATNGYGRSKLVASRVLDAASLYAGVPVAVVRVGQIAGPETNNATVICSSNGDGDGDGDCGAWNRNEWLPSIIASSAQALAMLPRDLGPLDIVDWTPVERIARLLLEVGGIVVPQPLPRIQGYFHGVNPSKTTWSGALAEAVTSFYGNRIASQVSWAEWVAALEQSASNGEDANKNPAIKLLDFYRGTTATVTGAAAGSSHLEFATERTMENSKTMRQMQAITPELLVRWCQQWRF